MSFEKVLLSILTALPGLIQGVEEIWGAFPGAGKVKKQAVLGGIGTILQSARADGVGGIYDEQQASIQAAASTAIDSYVAVANAVGAFQSGGRRSARVGED